MAESTSKSISSAEAVMLGALASGVNGPTWVILKFTFMMLAICLIAMLSLAFVSSEFMIVGHIVLLVIMGSVLFVLLHSICTLDNVSIIAIDAWEVNMPTTILIGQKSVLSHQLHMACLLTIGQVLIQASTCCRKDPGKRSEPLCWVPSHASIMWEGHPSSLGLNLCRGLSPSFAASHIYFFILLLL